ncbi:hypothetical protein [Algibacter sp. 2305UL17-15]|uniref:hypothetical protein n=1 Tax=Algibacter sp. 2305UL17-15 TaxID=3231268 RepID=UPI003459E388
MKNFTVFLTLLLLSQCAVCQVETNMSFATQMTTMFSPLNKNNVPHGILLDYGMEFTNVPAFKWYTYR